MKRGIEANLDARVLVLLLQLFDLCEAVLGPVQRKTLRVFVEPVPVSVDHINSWIAFKLLPMSYHEVPVQGVKGARLDCRFFFYVVLAVLTVITHFVDVVAASCIGFASNDAAISKLTHAKRIG
jgi:hypothetical protein